MQSHHDTTHYDRLSHHLESKSADFIGGNINFMALLSLGGSQRSQLSSLAAVVYFSE